MAIIDDPSTIAQRYRDAMVTGTIAPGTTWSLETEPRDLGIPPRVYRRAMRMLETMGLVTIQGDTVKAVPLNIQAIQDLEFTLTRRPF